MIREGKNPDSYPEAELRLRVCKFAAEHDALLHVISYEAMVQDPDGVGKELFRFLGLPPVPLETFDANAKYDGVLV